MQDDRSNSGSKQSLAVRIADSAMVIAAAGAALYFAGWTYRQTYYLHFGIDPSSLTVSNIAIAVEGLVAILTTFAAWLYAVLPMLVVTAIVMVVAQRIGRKRRPDHNPSVFDQIAMLMGRVGLCTLAGFLVLSAGTIAAKENVKDRFANVRSGKVWTYHLGSRIIAGVMIAQNDGTTWLLTKEGVRALRTSDISLTDGPLFTRAARES